MFIPNLHQANVPSRPVRGEIMCYDLKYCSDKNCCIVSLTNYEKERSKTIVTDALVAVLFVLAHTEQMGNQSYFLVSYGKVGLD